MDLKKHDTVAFSDEGATLTLMSPDGSGEPTDIQIVCYGPDSHVVTKLRREQSDRRLARARRPGGGKKVTAAELEAEDCAFLATATKGWSNMQENGKDLPFSYEEALRVYREYPWIMEQVNRFIADRANFTKG